jgi:hypothetical protein
LPQVIWVQVAIGAPRWSTLITARVEVKVESGRALVETALSKPLELTAGDKLVLNRFHPVLVTRGHPVAARLDDDSETRALLAPAVEVARRCYHEYIAWQAHPASRLVLQMRIVERDGSGRIDDDSERVVDLSTLDLDGVEACMKRAFEKLTLAAPKQSSLTVRFPFDFEAVPERKADYEHPHFIQPRF